MVYKIRGIFLQFFNLFYQVATNAVDFVSLTQSTLQSVDYPLGCHDLLAQRNALRKRLFRGA